MSLEKDCKNINNCKVILPTEDNKIVQFKNHKNKNSVPFIVYANFECLLEPIENNKHDEICHHKTLSVEYYVKYGFDSRRSLHSFLRQKN